MNRNKRKSTRVRFGAAVVEVAVVLPLFVIIILGTIEACSVIFLQQSLEVAAYEGARVSIVPRSNAGNVEAAASLQLEGRGIQDFSVTVVPSNFSTQPYGTFVRVQVSAPCNTNSLLFSTIYRSRTLTAEVEMMLER